LKKILETSVLKIYEVFLYIFIFTFLSNIALTAENVEVSQEFKSIKSNNANMRVGPGERFEILWNFKKAGLPIKIHKKFGDWYQVETPDGSIGWMWRNLISNKQKTIIFLKNEKIYKDKNQKSKIIANVDKNSILKVHYCKNEWCKVESKKYKIIGFVNNNSNTIWGAYVSHSK